MKLGKIRDDASDQMLNLLVYSVLTVLGMRLWFKIAGKIQITFGDWHIAHVLWGGLLMLIGMILILIFNGKKAKNWAVLFSGAGWGLFIDEIGKYLTKTNDYWFQPAIIFIYASFMALFLMYRWLENKQMKLKTSPPSFWEVIITKVSHVSYTNIFKRKVILGGMAIYSLYYAVDKLVDSVRILISPNRWVTVENLNRSYEIATRAQDYMIALKIGSEVVVAILFLTGLVMVARKKILLGLKYYRYGLLVSILLTSVFRFYFEQFSAVFGLILDILVYSWIDHYTKEKTPQA